MVKGHPVRYIVGHAGFKSPPLPADHARCSLCNAVKHKREMYLTGGNSLSARKTTYRTGHCKICQSGLNESRKDGYWTCQVKWRLRRNFNMTVKDYWLLFTAQHGVCAICGRAEMNRTKSGQLKRLHVDHDPATGKVRGLLCGNCNRGLGHFADDPTRLQSAAAYLLRSRLDDG